MPTTIVLNVKLMFQSDQVPTYRGWLLCVSVSWCLGQSGSMRLGSYSSSACALGHAQVDY
jgi:hypothetical protein